MEKKKKDKSKAKSPSPPELKEGQGNKGFIMEFITGILTKDSFSKVFSWDNSTTQAEPPKTNPSSSPPLPVSPMTTQEQDQDSMASLRSMGSLGSMESMGSLESLGSLENLFTPDNMAFLEALGPDSPLSNRNLSHSPHQTSNMSPISSFTSSNSNQDIQPKPMLTQSKGSRALRELMKRTRSSKVRRSSEDINTTRETRIMNQDTFTPNINNSSTGSLEIKGTWVNEENLVLDSLV